MNSTSDYKNEFTEMQQRSLRKMLAEGTGPSAGPNVLRHHQSVDTKSFESNTEIKEKSAKSHFKISLPSMNGDIDDPNNNNDGTKNLDVSSRGRLPTIQTAGLKNSDLYSTYQLANSPDNRTNNMNINFTGEQDQNLADD